jgi:hypothetical protein
MSDNDELAQAKLAAIHEYVPTGGVPQQALLKMAKLGPLSIIDGGNGSGHQRRAVLTSIEENPGVVPAR